MTEGRVVQQDAGDCTGGTTRLLPRRTVLASGFWLASGIALTGGCSAATDRTGSDSPSRKLSELANYSGEDWEEVMSSGVAGEGKVSIYTAIPPKTIQPLLEEFSKTFDVEASTYSATAEEVRRRIIEEQKARRFHVDVVLGGDALQHLILDAESALHKYSTPSTKAYNAARYGSDGTWYSLYENYFVAAYNTDLVKSPPEGYQDVLGRSWKLGVESSDVGWFATLVSEWGEKDGLRYFESLAAAEPFIVSGHTTLTNLVVSGEIPVAITVYNYRVEAEKEKGAPIEWVAFEPAVAIYNGISIPRKAPHPHAALALSNFLLSRDGQDQLGELTGQIPSHPKVPADPPRLKKGFESVPTAYKLLLKDYDEWQQRWEETVTRGQQTLGD